MLQQNQHETSNYQNEAKPMGEQKKRIEYIDLMKGICITLVVLLHCDVVFTGEYEFCNNYTKVFRMPLYFFLSGLFFKASIRGGGGNFLIKKVNNLIIPYLFFSLFIIPIHYYHGIDIGNWIYYIYCFLEPYSMPLWFLRSLFIVNILYFLLSKLTKNIYIRISSCFLISLVAWLTSPILIKNENIYIHWILFDQNFISSIFTLPYIAVADWCRSKNILTYDFSFKRKCMIIIALIMLLMMFTVENFELRTAMFPENILFFYISSFSGIFLIMMIARIFNKVFFLSYIGRYSLIVLGVHQVLLKAVIIIVPDIHPYISAIINLACAPIYIYILKKFFPYFTAQKPLLEYVDGRIVLPWNRNKYRSEKE